MTYPSKACWYSLSREKGIPANQSAALNTGHVSQLSTNRLGLILFLFVPTRRSSSHPRRNQSVTEAGVVPPVAYCTSLSGVPLLGWESNRDCRELAQSCHRYSVQGTNFCHGWAQAAEAWKPPLPCKWGRKHGWHEPTQEAWPQAMDKQSPPQRHTTTAVHVIWSNMSSFVTKSFFWGSSEREQHRQDKHNADYLHWRSHTCMCSDTLSFTITDVLLYFLYG